MELKIFENYNDLSDYVSEEILETVVQKPDALLCLATGDTPLLSYKKLAERSAQLNAVWRNVRFAALDEWVGVPPENPGSCRSFLHQHLFGPLNFSEGNIHLFNGMAPELQKECAYMDRFIEANGPVDLMVVGIGPNGHVGFNEPGVNPDLLSHVIELDHSTKAVGQKYFPFETPLTKGITLGFGHIFQAKKVILVANGAHKAPVILSSVTGEISPDVPASLLRKHSRSIFCVDRDAASLLDL